jgi:hypothetical protein
MEESALQALGESLAGDNEWVSSGILASWRRSMNQLTPAQRAPSDSGNEGAAFHSTKLV